MNMYLIQLINVEISIENDTGKIVKENYETRSMRVIASSLSELISELKPSIIDYEV